MLVANQPGLSFSKAARAMKELYIDSFDRSLMGEQVAGGGEIERVTDRRVVCVNIQNHQYTKEENAASLNTDIPNNPTNIKIIVILHWSLIYPRIRLCSNKDYQVLFHAFCHNKIGARTKCSWPKYYILHLVM